MLYTAIIHNLLFTGNRFNFYFCSKVYHANYIFRILITLRKYSGGYHLNNADVCFINSIFITIIAHYISRWLANSYGDSGLVFLVLSVVLLAVIVSQSPVNHSNLHLTKNEAKAMKIRIAKIATIISAVLIVSAAVKSEMLFPIFVAIMTDFILIAAAKLTHQEMKYIVSVLF